MAKVESESYENGLDVGLLPDVAYRLYTIGHCQVNAKIYTFVQEQEEQGLIGSCMNPWILAPQRGVLCLGGPAAIRDFR